MPFGDGTGPQGLGPRTGRGAGYCSGFGSPGSMNFSPGGPGTGFGRGGGSGLFGRGRGWRNCFRITGLPGWARGGYGYPYATSVSAREATDFLRTQSEFLKRQIEDIRRRLDTLEKAETKED